MIVSILEGALVSFSGCVVLTPAVRALCARHRILDRPGPLKIHTYPIPRLGGVAVAFSMAAGIVVSVPDDLRTNAFFWAALGVVWIAGLADDLRSISPYARMAAQIASGVLLWLGGWRFLIGDSLPGTGAISLIVVCGSVAAFTNALNLLDGSDGLACGVAAIIGAAWLAISHGGAQHTMTPAVAACLAGSCAGFAFYNFAPASIHLGDSGSTVLGFCVALLALSPAHTAQPAPSLAPSTLLISALPIADCALAVFRRLRSHTSLLQGDRSHIYDRMLARGYSARTVAVCFYTITAALGAAAWLCLQVDLLWRSVICALLLAGMLVCIIWLRVLTSGNNGIRPDGPANFAAHGETGLPL